MHQELKIGEREIVNLTAKTRNSSQLQQVHGMLKQIESKLMKIKKWTFKQIPRIERGTFIPIIVKLATKMRFYPQPSAFL